MTEKQNEYPSYFEIFKYWLKLWFISFGWPVWQIAIMHQELVERKKWISEHRFLHALNFCMLLPGPEAIQLAIYIWWLFHWVIWWITAWILFFLPSFFLLIWIWYAYLVYGKLALFAWILWWIKPAVTAIVIFAAYRIWTKTLKNKILILFAVLSFIWIFFFKINFPIIVLTAWILWYIWWKIIPDYFKMNMNHWWWEKDFWKAIIDDNSPLPEWVKFSWKKTLLFIFCWLWLWIIAFLILIKFFWLNWIYTQMWWFFTKAAFLTIGWAYAVLPYIYDWAVNTFWWMSWAQMIDWLAFWETTPWPLIMIVTFVWFLAWWIKEALWVDNLFMAWFIWASVATFFTFLPSFIFILVWWPIVESTKNDLKFTSPLTWISTAIVWVIINLWVFFAIHTYFPNNVVNIQWIDYLAVILTIITFIAMQKYKIWTIKIILACAALGLVKYFLF